MKTLILGFSALGALVCVNTASGQGAPPPGYGVMGVPPPGYGAPPPGYGAPPSVPAYPNSMPPPSTTAMVTPPPVYTDPYASAPPPGPVSSYAPQGTSNYSPPPVSPGGYAGNGGYGSAAKTGPDIVNYDNLEVFYRYVAPKEADLNGAHTIGGALQLALFNPLYLKFGASWGSGTGGAGATGGNAKDANYDFASISAGAGFHTSLIHDRLTFVAEAGLTYASLRAKDSSISFSDGSIYVRPALRFTPFDWLEVQGGVTVSSADKYDSKILDLSAYFRVLPMLDLGIGADFGDATRAFRTAVRLRW
ncbi:MAG TPA: hypothetical protein VGE39_25965 [Prosthecobacter sp.]